MGCTKQLSLTLNQPPEICPLNQAVYSAAANKIFGMQGGWLHRFNATTGAREASTMIYPNIMGESYICVIPAHGAVSEWLYVGIWGTLSGADFTIYDPLLEPSYPGRDIHRINPLTMAVTPLNIWQISIPLGFWGNVQGFSSGFRSICTDGSNVIALFSTQSSSVAAGVSQWIIKFDPFNIVASFLGADDHLYYGTIHQIIYDAGNHVSWTSACDYSGMAWHDMNDWHGAPFFEWHYDYIDCTGDYLPHGVVSVPGTDTVYGLTQSPILVKTSIAGTATNTYSGVNTGVGNATPIRAQYHTGINRILIPNWKDNSVSVFNPATDSLDPTFGVAGVISGFISPIDVVFTPSKSFAVQDAIEGLKEIVLV